MRPTMVMTIGTLALAALAGCDRKAAEPATAPPARAAADAATAAVATAGGAPVRKAGLWEQTIATAGVEQTTRLCLDAATDAQLSVWGAQAGKQACPDQQLSRGIDGSYSFKSVCDMGGGGKTISSGIIKGDFNSRYVVEATSTTEGAAVPHMNGARTMRLTAVWKGPCPAGFAPGDMELPGGQKFNLARMGETFAKGKQ